MRKTNIKFCCKDVKVWTYVFLFIADDSCLTHNVWSCFEHWKANGYSFYLMMKVWLNIEFSFNSRMLKLI